MTSSKKYWGVRPVPDDRVVDKRNQLLFLNLLKRLIGIFCPLPIFFPLCV
jgi:hypothetical protein